MCPCLLLLLLLRRLTLRLFWATPSRGMALEKSHVQIGAVKYSAGIVFTPGDIMVEFRFTVVSWGMGRLLYRDARNTKRRQILLYRDVRK